MGYTGLTQPTIVENEEWRSEWIPEEKSFAHPFEGDASLQERLKALIKDVVVFPDTVVKINGIASLLRMFDKPKYAGMSMKTVTKEILNGSMSDKTLEMIEEMAEVIRANYVESKLPKEECDAEKIKHDMVTTLSPEENKQFLMRLAWGTNLPYAEYKNMCSYMKGCERIDFYKKEELVLRLVVENQQYDRYNTYCDLLEDYSDVAQVKGAENRDELKDRIEDFGTMDIAKMDKPVGMIYVMPGPRGIRQMHPEIKRRISEQKTAIKLRIERSPQWVRNNLIEEIKKKLETSDSYVAQLAREVSKNQDRLVASLRLKFDKGTKITIPKGTAFVIRFGNDVIELTTNEDKESNANQMKRGNMDIKAYAYGKPLANDKTVVKAGEMVLLSEYPKGVKDVTNNKDIQFGNVELSVTYDPGKFIGCKPLTLWGCVGKSKKPTVRIITEAMPDPVKFTAIVPVRGDIGTIEVEKDYQHVENQTNRWYSPEIMADLISVETMIQCDEPSEETDGERKTDGIKHGELLVTSSIINKIPEGTMFIFEKKRKKKEDGTEETNTEECIESSDFEDTENLEVAEEDYDEYYYWSTEEVKHGVIKVSGQIYGEAKKDLKLGKQELVIDPSDRQRAESSGIIRIENTRGYAVPKSLFNCFMNVMFGRSGANGSNKGSMDLPAIGNWLNEAELSPDIVNSRKVTRNDIITLTFLLLGLNGIFASQHGYDSFINNVNYHLGNCGFHPFYQMNPYERLIGFMAQNLKGDEALNGYQMIWEEFYRQKM